MAKPEALNNLVAALRKDFEANGNGGPFQKQFFADPFCTMARFGLDADDRNCLLTMSKEVVAKYLKDASQSEGEWLEKWSGPGTGWDAEDGIPDNPIPVEEYLKLQKRFAHLFGDPPERGRLALIQAAADRNVERFGLL